MDKFLTDILTVVGVAFILLVVGAVAGSIVTGRQIRDAIAAQPAPIIHNTATANAGGDGGGGVGIGVPQIIGLFGAVAFVAWAATGFRTGSAIDQQVERINALATAAPMPTLAVTAPPVATVSATAQPVATVLPVVVPQRVVVDSYPHPDTIPNGEETITPLKVAVGVLAVMASGLWGYAGLMLWRRRSIKRPNVVTPARAVQARERRMEDILPESVHEVAR